jgi:glycosyltransferase involved in cell wall biosynthesis
MIIFNGVSLIEGTRGVIRYAHCALDALRNGPHGSEVEVWLPSALVSSQNEIDWPRIRIYPGPSPRRGFSFCQIFWANCLAWHRRRNFPNARVFSPLETYVFGSWGNSLITAHDCYADRFGDPSKGGKVGRGRRLAVRQLRRSRVLAVSEFTANELSALHGLGPERVSTTPNWLARGFDDNPGPIKVQALREKYGLPENFWLYVGGFRTNKNLPFLLSAYATTLRSRKLPPLVLAGDWPEDDTPFTGPINRIWESAGLSEKLVKRIGFVSDDDLPSLYQSAELMISPSSYEGFGYPVIEAAAVGTPVIAARSASLPEVWPHPELLFSPDDPAELIQLLGRVAESDSHFARRPMESKYTHQAGESYFNQAIERWLQE